ncbi:MAG: SusE domain-containing protein [Bacteroidales bacterium]|nr:SusE domain-containing protein [Bacteroidales bacterium]
MKRIKYSLLPVFALLLAACDPNGLEISKTAPESQFVSPKMQSMPAVQVSQANYDDQNAVVTFSWEKADLGLATELSYSIYLSSESHPDMCLVSGVTKTSYSIDYKTLYAKLVGESNLGLSKGTSHDVPCYVTASMGDGYYLVKSDPMTVKFDIARISTGINMLYLSGSFNNNHPDRDGIEETVSGQKQYQGLVNMKSSGANKVKFLEYTYSGKNEGDAWGDDGSGLKVGGAAIDAPAELAYVRADLNAGTYSITKLDGPVRLCGLGGWWFGGNPELVYNAEEKAWIGEADYTSGTFRMSINDNWGFTFGPKRAADLTVRDGSDIKIYHNDIAKKALGGDANFKIASAGRYRFKFYYESADCTWHLAINVVK